ncbi:hypothetical protein [Metallibacterium sp.]|jgi:hypothetical protein|uniref:hypothetical protein n=1 Tax=Metallibacterium sp. TaxID=2940281 RepID=UPI002609EAC4|nr:hypothetical protein [Metallibacterium sp.]
MTAIQCFERIRADGKIIDESMKAADMFALGFPEKIVEIKWRNYDDEVSLQFPYGVLAAVVAGRNFLAINESDAQGQRSLWVLNSDGTRRLQVSDVQEIGAQAEAVSYRWFEGARNNAPNAFGVVFERLSDKSMFQVDIDAEGGNAIAIYPMR